jgi:hypothetical protein
MGLLARLSTSMIDERGNLLHLRGQPDAVILDGAQNHSIQGVRNARCTNGQTCRIAAGFLKLSLAKPQMFSVALK